MRYEYMAKAFEGTIYEILDEINEDKALIGWELFAEKPTSNCRTQCIFKRERKEIAPTVNVITVRLPPKADVPFLAPTSAKKFQLTPGPTPTKPKGMFTLPE